MVGVAFGQEVVFKSKKDEEEFKKNITVDKHKAARILKKLNEKKDNQVKKETIK